jgi:sugar phosphate isomerase/epimerase
MPSLPVKIGAAMMTPELSTHREWLIAGQRDLELQDACLPSVLDGDWRTLVQHARTLLRGFTGRLGIHGPFLGLTLAAHDPQVRALVTARLLRGIAIGSELGATHMVVHSPFECFGTPFSVWTPASRRAEMQALVHATLEAVLPQAEAAGIMLVIENIADAHPQPLIDLVRSFDSPLVRMSLDTGHAAIMERVGGPPPDQWVREAGDLLAHVHLQDNDGHADRHWAPGDGPLNWYALFTALSELEQTPRLVLELNQHTLIPRGAAYLIGRGLAD